MKPRGDQDISKARVAKLRGGEIEPLSKLAAKQPNQRAELFTLDDTDRELLAKVFATDDGRIA